MLVLSWNWKLFNFIFMKTFWLEWQMFWKEKKRKKNQMKHLIAVHVWNVQLWTNCDIYIKQKQIIFSLFSVLISKQNTLKRIKTCKLNFCARFYFVKKKDSNLFGKKIQQKHISDLQSWFSTILKNQAFLAVFLHKKVFLPIMFHFLLLQSFAFFKISKSGSKCKKLPEKVKYTTQASFF